MRNLLALVLLAGALPAYALDTPYVLTTQGRLLNADDTLVTSDLDVTVTIWDAAEGGTQKWSKKFTQVKVSKGFYALTLGDDGSLDAAALAGPRWIGFAVGETVLTPRQRVGVAPLAIVADKAGDAAKLGGVAAADYATKDFVTTAVAAAAPVGFARLDGATFTGPVVLAGDPSADGQAATKKYVDTAAGAAYTKEAADAKFLTQTAANGDFATKASLSGYVPKDADGSVAVGGNLTVAGNVTVTGAINGNGASLANVNAATLGGKAASDFLTAASLSATETFDGSAIDTNKWTKTGPGTAAIEAGRLRTSAGGNVYLTSKPGFLPYAENFVLEFDASWTNQADFGVFFRQTATAGWAWIFRDKNNGSVDSYFHTTGAPGVFSTPYCSTPHQPISNSSFVGTNVKMKLVVNGPTVDGYANGTWIIRCTDPKLATALQAGGVGFYACSCVGDHYFDNVKVTALGPTTDPLANVATPGTIVQQIVNTSTATASLNTSVDTEANTAYRINFTPRYANSKVLVEYNFPINTDMAVNTLFHMKMFRNIGASTEVAVASGPTNSARLKPHFVGRPNGYDGNDMQTVNMVAVDSGLVAGTTYTYGFKYHRETGGSGTTYFNYSVREGNEWGFSGIMVMKVTEIAQ